MKTTKQQIVLTARNTKAGVRVPGTVQVEDVPYRKLTLDTLNQVRFARKPVIISNYGKPLALILPLADDAA